MPDRVKTPLNPAAIDIPTFYIEQNSPLLDTSSLTRQVVDLQGSYTFLSDSSLVTNVLMEVPSLYSLLKDALDPLQFVFGQQRLLQLEVLKSDEDAVLRVMVKLPADTPKAAELMRKFKRDWWLKNCARSYASLIFDYEIGDAF